MYLKGVLKWKDEKGEFRKEGAKRREEVKGEG